MHFRRFPTCFAILSFTVLLQSPLRAEVLEGPVRAQVLRVIDGDTFLANALIWPGQTITVSVRIRGIDAAEMHASCAAENALARKAKAALTEMIADGYVSISQIGGGKYYGRVLANVTAMDGSNIAATMLGSMLVRPYDPKSRHWACNK